MKRLFILAAASFLALTVPSASAQAERIDGTWVFKAWTGDGCQFNGVATIGTIKTGETSSECELTATQTCQDREWIVRQTCTIKRSGDRVAIKSQIAEFLGEASDSYLPDDFLLTVDTTRRMFGALHSYGVYKSEWMRDEGAIS